MRLGQPASATIGSPPSSALSITCCHDPRSVKPSAAPEYAPNRRLCLFSNSVPMDCAPRTECPVLAHAAFRRGLIAHSVQGAIQDGAPPTCLAAGEQPGPAAAACRGAIRGRFPLLRHAGPDHGAGGRFTGGQGGGRPRSAPSRQVLRAGGMGVCVAGLGAVRPRGWPSGRWMDGVRGMGLPWRCRGWPGPATFLVRCRLRR